MRAHGIMFHHFHDHHHPRGQGAISSDDLDRMIAFLGRDRILPAREWMRRAIAHTLTPTDLCFTFDDNLRCQYDIALPVLQRHGITAFWFVYTSVVEGGLEPLEIYRYFRTTRFTTVEVFYSAFFAAVDRSDFAPQMQTALASFDPRRYLAGFPFYTDEDRRFRFVRDEVLCPAAYCRIMDAMIQSSGIDLHQLAGLLWMDRPMLRRLHDTDHVVGLHSHTHPTRIERMTPADQASEYHSNARVLTQITGHPPRAMSHPCNSYNTDTLATLRTLGITLGFRANMAEVPASELEWPREDHANVMKTMQEAHA